MTHSKKTLLIVLLLAICMILLVSFANLKLAAFDSAFYEKEFSKYNPNINNSIGITKDLLYYLEHRDAGEGYINKFSHDEQAHLKEVKQHFQMMFAVLTILIFMVPVLILLLYYADKKKFLKNITLFFIIKGFGMLAVGLLFVCSFTNFETAFSAFHKMLLFGQWQFPSESMLITLFPMQFFADIAKRLLINTFIFAGVFLAIGLMLYIGDRRSKKMAKELQLLSAV